MATRIALTAALCWTLAVGPPAQANEETIRRTAQEEGIDPDLAAAVARCESGYRSEATNGRYKGPFQMSDGWGSESERRDPEWATRQFAGAVRAGTASRHWAQCWPGRRQSRRAVGNGRSVRAGSPTGTDRCDRASGTWRCHPSWTKPDALTVSPTIEADPGPQILGCHWEGETWMCEVVPLAAAMPVSETASSVTSTLPPASPSRSADLWPLFAGLAIVAILLAIGYDVIRNEE